MRVLLVNANLKNDVYAAAPIGLCYVATAAEAAGHEVKVLDLCFQRSIGTALKDSIRSLQPQVIGVSLRNMDNANMLHPVSYLPDAAKLIQQMRALTGAPIVVGGAGASLSPKGVLEVLHADFIIVSEGEESFCTLLKSLEDGQSPDSIPGVGMIRDDGFHLVPPKRRALSLGNPRVGKWINLRPYSKMGACYSVQTKRGCTHRCIYCTYNQVLEGNTLRLRSPLEVVDEVEEAIQKYKARYVEFVDSVFNEPRGYVTEILEEIARRRLRVELTAMGMNPRNLDREFLDLMWRAGFTSFQISPESASETMIRNYGKNLTLEDIIQSAEAINKTRFTVLWHFLVGGPGETNETLEETIQFVLKYLHSKKHPPYNMANIWMGVRIYPGTSLWDIASDEGFIPADSDATEQLWYLSRDLDLGIAMDQLIRAASAAPEVILGFDERYCAWSRLGAFVCKILRSPKPYWRGAWDLNRFLLKTGLRFLSQPEDVAGELSRKLERQGYHGASAGKASRG